jgi:hypothetical protein
MATQMLAERDGKIFEQDEVAAVALHVVQRMGQREFVGSDIFAKED